MVDELIKRDEGAISAWDRVSDPLAFVAEMGRVFWQAGVGGAKTEADGKVLALACLTTKRNPFELTARNHLIDGKLSLKADVILADFNASGGKHRWLKDGDDGVAAELELTRADGEMLVSSFSLADAKEQGLVKPNSRWAKGPKAVGDMLRARCTSRGVRMLQPSILAGSYTPEELEDSADSRPEPRGGRRTKAEAEARQKELAETAPQAGDVVDASYTVAPDPSPAPAAATAATEQPPFEVPPRPAPEPEFPGPIPAQSAEAAKLQATLMEIQHTIMLMGVTEAQLVEQMRAKNPAWISLDALPIADAERVLASLKAALARAQMPAK